MESRAPRLTATSLFRYQEGLPTAAVVGRAWEIQLPGFKMAQPPTKSAPRPVDIPSCGQHRGEFPQELGEREGLRDVTRPALRGTSVRISLAAFVEERDVDLLLDSLAALAAGR
jgi:hypothetical protein